MTGETQPIGTKLTIRNVRALVAIRCKADITVDCQKHL